MPTLYSDFYVDPVTKDLDFSGGDFKIIESNLESLRQRLYLRFNIWTGDWYFDETFGFPYRSFISQKVMKAVLDGKIRSTVREEPDALAIEDFKSVMDVVGRTYSCFFTVVTREGEELSLAFSGSDKFTPPTPPEGNISLCGDDNQFIMWQNKLYYLINFRLPIYGDATWYNKWSGQDPLVKTTRVLATQGGQGITTQDGKLLEREN